VRKGGLARRATFIEQNTKKDAAVIIADAGNFTSANKREGADFTDCMLKGMGKIGYNVLGISKKDIDNGIDVLKDAEHKYGMTFVCANVYDKKAGRPLFRPYIIKKDAGLKIGIFGLTEELFWRDKAVMDSLGIETRPYRDVCGEILKRIRGKVNFVVLLTDLRSTSLDSLLAKNPGIDLVITTGAFQPGVAKSKQAATLVAGTGFRGFTGDLVEIPFDPQHPDSIAFKQIDTELTETIGSDSVLASLITDCKPKTEVPPKESQVIPTEPGKQVPPNAAQTQRPPVPRPVTRTIPPAGSEGKPSNN